MSSRRKKFLISVLKYSISLAIAIFLFLRVYRGMNFRDLIIRFEEIDKFLLGASVFLGLVSYYFRAYRWNILLEPLGYQLKAPRTFLSVMTGYFANLLVPRMGEITRCGVLKKTDNVDFASSFGSVVAERALDMLVLLSLTFFGFLIEFDKLMKIFGAPLKNAAEKFEHLFAIVVGAACLGITCLFLLIYLLRRNREHLRHNALFIKARSIIRSLLNGLWSIKKIKRPAAFWFSTAAIWTLYFFMTYVVFLAFGPTMGLGIKAGLLVLIMGGIGMAIPVQGGIGSFHLLVSAILLLYGVQEKNSDFFALVLHTSQVLSVLAIGGISYVIVLFIKGRNAKKIDIG